MKLIEIFFNKTMKDSTVEFKLQGHTLGSRREIQEHRFYSSGDALTVDKYSSYIVRINKDVFVEEDPSKTCRNYPNANFASYNDCDDQFMRDKLEEVAPGLDLTPPWLADNLDNVTSQPVSYSPQMHGNILLGMAMITVVRPDCCISLCDGNCVIKAKY